METVQTPCKRVVVAVFVVGHVVGNTLHRHAEGVREELTNAVFRHCTLAKQSNCGRYPNPTVKPSG